MRTQHDPNEDGTRATKPRATLTSAKRTLRPARPAPRRGLMRAWAPAILATFFLGSTASTRP